MAQKKYKYYSGNAHHIHVLLEVTAHMRQAYALDQLIFLSANSTFRLPDESNSSGWCCIPYDQLALQLRISVRTLTNYLAYFEQHHLIERCLRKINGDKRACLKIASKTRLLVGLPPDTASQSISTTTQQHPLPPTHKAQHTTRVGQGDRVFSKPTEIEEKTTTARKNLTQLCRSGLANIAVPYKESKEKTKNINITPMLGESSFHQDCPPSVSAVLNQVHELSQGQKQAIWQAVRQLTTRYRVNLSKPDEFVAWVCFAIIHAPHQLKGATDFEHQLNRIMAIARSPKGFSRPRGFHQHWHVGQTFYQCQQQAEAAYEADKQAAFKEQGGNHVDAHRQPATQALQSVLSELKAVDQLFADQPELQASQRAPLEQRRDTLLQALCGPPVHRAHRSQPTAGLVE